MKAYKIAFGPLEEEHIAGTKEFWLEDTDIPVSVETLDTPQHKGKALLILKKVKKKIEGGGHDISISGGKTCRIEGNTISYEETEGVTK